MNQRRKSNLRFEYEFSAPNYINSPQLGNQTIIVEGGNITYKAGQAINLLEGFETQLGSSFHAIIEECGL